VSPSSLEAGEPLTKGFLRAELAELRLEMRRRTRCLNRGMVGCTALLLAVTIFS